MTYDQLTWFWLSRVYLPAVKLFGKPLDSVSELDHYLILADLAVGHLTLREAMMILGVMMREEMSYIQLCRGYSDVYAEWNEEKIVITLVRRK